MAWRYKQEYVQDGDVVEPSEWRINVNETMSELNGFLDSDNLGRDSITNSIIKRGTFSKVLNAQDRSTLCWVFDHAESGWIRESKTTVNQDLNETKMQLDPAKSGPYKAQESGSELSVKKLPHIKFAPEEDGLLIVEFSGNVNWMASASHPDLDGFYLDVPFSTTDSHDNDDQVGQSYGYFARQTKNFKSYSALILCSMWRLTVNGQSVAETGPIGNEYSCHPIYLCGATPILKNTETVVQIEAQFVWYSLGQDNSLSSSSFNPTTRTKANGQTNIPFRRDCSLFCNNLIATYRKR